MAERWVSHLATCPCSQPMLGANFLLVVATLATCTTPTPRGSKTPNYTKSLLKKTAENDKSYSRIGCSVCCSEKERQDGQSTASKSRRHSITPFNAILDRPSGTKASKSPLQRKNPLSAATEQPKHKAPRSDKPKGSKKVKPPTSFQAYFQAHQARIQAAEANIAVIEAESMAKKPQKAQQQPVRSRKKDNPDVAIKIAQIDLSQFAQTQKKSTPSSPIAQDSYIQARDGSSRGKSSRKGGSGEKYLDALLFSSKGPFPTSQPFFSEFKRPPNNESPAESARRTPKPKGKSGPDGLFTPELSRKKRAAPSFHNIFINFNQIGASDESSKKVPLLPKSQARTESPFPFDEDFLPGPNFGTFFQLVHEIDSMAAYNAYQEMAETAIAAQEKDFLSLIPQLKLLLEMERAAKITGELVACKSVDRELVFCANQLERSSYLECRAKLGSQYLGRNCSFFFNLRLRLASKYEEDVLSINYRMIRIKQLLSINSLGSIKQVLFKLAHKKEQKLKEDLEVAMNFVSEFESIVPSFLWDTRRYPISTVVLTLHQSIKLKITREPLQMSHI